MKTNLDVAAAARYLGVSASYLNKARCFGTGPRFLRLGKRCVRYRVEALDRWMQEREVGSTSEPIASAARRSCR